MTQLVNLLVASATSIVKKFHVNILLSITIIITLSLPAWARVNQLTTETPKVIQVNGDVRNLKGTRQRPDFLVVLVNERNNTKGGQPGIHVFSIADKSHPLPTGYLRIESGENLKLLPGGRTAVLRSVVQNKNGQRNVVSIINLTDPTAPAITATLGQDVSSFAISESGTRLVMNEKSSTQGSDGQVSIYDISKLSQPTRLGFFPLESQYAELSLFRNGRCLLVHESREHGQLYDLSSPASPRLITHLVSATMPAGVLLEKPEGAGEKYGDSGSCTLNKETLVPVENDSTSKIDISEDGRIAFVSDLNKKIAVYDLSMSPPQEIDSYYLPDYPHAVYQSSPGGILYVAMEGGIAVLAPHSGPPSAAAIVKAHHQALQTYGVSSGPGEYERRDKALASLETAGIRRIIAAPPEGMTPRQYAHILNDYAFIKLQDTREASDAISILRRVILVDPARAVAYLNLGDALREHAFSGELDKKRNVTAEIITLYQKYIKLTGKSTRNIDSFLRMNLLNTRFKNVCDYVTAYVNGGRANELATLVASIDLDGDGEREDIVFRREGTAHFLSLIVEDRENGSENYLEPAESTSDEMDLVQFGGRTYLLHSSSASYPDYIGMFQPDLSEKIVCRFSTAVTEHVDKAAGVEAFCSSLLHEKPEKRFLPFRERHSVEESSLKDPEEQYHSMEPTGAQTLDFDNDGKRESLLRVEYSSGAGPGCAFTYFELLNSRTNGIVANGKGKLLRSLQSLSPGAHHPVPYCGGNTAGWFIKNGKTYFENMYFNGRPHNSESEHHEVFAVERNGFKKVCTYKFSTSTSVLQPEKKAEHSKPKPGRIEKLKNWAIKIKKSISTVVDKK